MKHPFWLLNSLLLAFLIAVIIFIFFSQQKPPRRFDFLPEVSMLPAEPTKGVSQAEISPIYTQDLFGTYQQPAVIPQKEIEQAPTKQAIPKPPEPQPVKIALAPPPKFSEPLPITLKGIMVIDDDSNNIAIIQDNKSPIAQNYKVGDKIEDAQLIRIMHNKIMFVRANGQQETIYINSHDAELEQLMFANNNWTLIVQKTSDTMYTVDPEAFTMRISNLAQFIEALNIISVYSKGRVVGCRIGKIPQNSLGYALGLMPGDIILNINGTPTADQSERFKIYKQITQMKNGDIISVAIQRGQQELSLQYTLQTGGIEKQPLGIQGIAAGGTIIGEKSPQALEAEKIKLLEQKERLAPTYEQLIKEEKRNMFMNGGKEHVRTKNVLSNSARPDN